MTLQIRWAQEPDTAFLPAIETSAAELFRRDPELAWLADAEVTASSSHARHLQQHPLWVAVAADGQRCGFLSAQVCERELHIQEVSVASHCQGRGIGKALLQAAIEHAREQGLEALTLSTFRQLPWNEPFYQRLGFITLAEAQLGPRLRKVLANETLHGLPAERRCAKRLAL